MKKFIVVMTAMAVLLGSFGVACAAQKQEEAKALVIKAVAFMKENGNEKAFAEFNNPKGKFVKGDLYIFVNDAKGTTVAHGGNQKLIGKNMLELKDSEGTYFIKDFIKTAKNGGGWTEYKWTNPVSKKIESKRTYVAPSGDMVVGCGYYK
jgi:signal transduction histidine kinase